ncbi:MAG: malonyl-ACP O-methyltransferase [Rikenellaceae bacterium]|nr:malonyl-ACP O-methyltransferase [Rikenellaceae bacterium]
MIDKNLIRERFGEAIATYDDEAVAQRRIACRLSELMRPYTPKGGHIFEAGCGTGIMSRLLINEFTPASLLMVDLSESYRHCLADIEGPAVRFVAEDAEEVELPQGLSAVVSSSAMQWFDNPARFILRCSEALACGGVMAIATYGVDNMREIGSLSGVRLHYPSCDELKAMIAPSLSLEHMSQELITMTFPSAREALRHLRRTGVAAIERPLGVAATRRLIADYDSLYHPVTLTYHPVYIVARKK